MAGRKLIQDKPRRQEERRLVSIRVEPSLWRMARGTAALMAVSLEEFLDRALRHEILAAAYDEAVKEQVKAVLGTTTEST